MRRCRREKGREICTAILLKKGQFSGFRNYFKVYLMQNGCTLYHLNNKSVSEYNLKTQYCDQISEKIWSEKKVQNSAYDKLYKN
jgi:hypothetical protein